MLSSNSKLNIILTVVCIILAIVILYLLSYRHNIDSINVFFNENDIKNITWKNEDMTFKTDGKKFTLTVNNEEIYTDEAFNLNTHTGMIIEDVLYLRSVSPNSITIWYKEADYRLNRTE